MARGEYIIFVDADDYLEPDAFQIVQFNCNRLYPIWIIFFGLFMSEWLRRN